jgi:hypothetical protein
VGNRNTFSQCNEVGNVSFLPLMLEQDGFFGVSQCARHGQYQVATIGRRLDTAHPKVLDPT